ncbi:tRNA preQ1(34) S-adenosylmethionine ribosyltransferase-isomerase QueA [Candidatus Falkowbacteria bacterium HGW-Falkowbacteria-1]|uniref:S-adenosylmethionine:tRNA ribosyltransferase-isomerase n=1 Tax=Candidatus Falkowbacteria bacterium HGW-Falkowbacteria-1 TaxID=2013768 RepID=A0A2N2EAH0_9BACT|nr:MAG: tRNA preQ1(34) S-adenosylmethionine ribosyltransferase-isomerase QueA [Candidatus Falkowbacteria bacterium HGW-Falkowbacteria-1]
MNLADFDYELPKNLIAQEPANPRDHSRLLIYNRANGEIDHRHFCDLFNYLNKDDVLFINNSKVFNARLISKKESGGKVEIFLLKVVEKNKNIWKCLLGGRVVVGKILKLAQGIKAEVLEKNEGTFLLKFDLDYERFIKKLEEIGETPLPPYIKRSEKLNRDVSNYQTVYAKNEKIGSSAAPTAGLHFNKEILEKIKSKGVEIVEATLHVGLGTFLPVKTENILEHKMHSEDVEISLSSINKIVEAKNKKKRIVAVGTTSCRILESLNNFLKYDCEKNKFLEYKGQDLKFSTDIFIYPGYEFKIVDSLITNFHLPKSSLLMLVSALAGRKNILEVYNKAIEEKYRFFSYGDAMFIV